MPCPRTQQANLPACSPQPPLNAERQAGKLQIPFFKVFWYDSTRGMKPRSTDCEADALTTTPSRIQPHPKAGPRVQRRPNRRERRSAVVTSPPEKNTLQALKNARLKPTPVQAKPRKRKLQLSAKVTKTTEWHCLVCGDSYSNSAPGEEWV